METLLIVVAFWLILLGVYGAIFLPRGGSLFVDRPSPSRAASLAAFSASAIEPHAKPVAEKPVVQKPVATAAPAKSAPNAGGIYSEVDMLRAQVEQLRSEIQALSSGGSGDRPERYRRTPGGAPAYLPRPLQRQVREVRSSRRLIRV